ncbi:GSCFA domain-containing protein [Fibrobacter sp.]|uniref:GSCFA domain-containing protein n=1 Tax=Fibrobacter sp. TaxID=35828 RepID=UPI003864FA7D
MKNIVELSYYIYLMDFFTKIDIPAEDWQIDYNSRLAFFGSCFADNISAQFRARKFNVLANPFGTVYNPLSAAMQIKAIANRKIFGEADIFQDMRLGVSESRNEIRGSWHCWNAHGSLSAATREECIEKLNVTSHEAREFLQNADVVFITLGTAFVYFLKKSGIAVSNCHRQNPNLFIRKMISVDHAAEALKSIVHDLLKIKNDWIASPGSHASLGVSVARNDVLGEHNENRELHIIFTVSPLRHLSDGAHENTLSKATLQLAIEKVIRECATESAATVTYFPSYEIVMDELRDYRFYNDDMIHLSKKAEEYIFERMARTYCNEKTHEDIRKVEKFMKMANHRIVDSQAPTAQEFAQKITTEAEKLEKEIAGLNLDIKK